MADLFRFRCSACGKLLGVSARKVGRPVACPKCGTELIVPEPADDEPAAVGEPDDFAGLGIDLGIASPLDLRPPADRPASRREARGADLVEAVAFLEGVAADPPAFVGSAIADLPAPPDEGDSTPAAGGASLDEEVEPEPLIQSPVEPLIPRRRRSQVATAPPGDRRRDVVLPRTAVVAWSLFAIVALGLAFVAGLMIGHYRWR